MNPMHAPAVQVNFTGTRITTVIGIMKKYLFLLAICCAAITVKSQSQSNRYNVLLIYADDMNNKVGYLGYPVVLTPNLQRLMNKGVAFTNAYCQFSICNPSRISVMSGWRPDKTKVTTNDADPALRVPSNVKYLQDFFHSNGYRTERYGKIYHEQFEYEFNWDYFENYKDTSNTDFTDVSTKNQFIASATGSGTHANLWGITAAANFINADSIMATHAAMSLDTMVDQPKFVGLGLIETHAPFNPPIESWNVYGDSSIQVPLPYMGSQKTVLGNSAHNIVLPNTPSDDRDDVPPIAFYRNTTITMEDSEWQKAIQAYYAEVTLMDKNLGRILDELDKNNLWENTVVVFVSDHGQHLGEHLGLWYKNTLFNEAQQVPLIICAPGVQPGVCDKMVEEVDIYPTLTELCKLPTPPGMQGVSLVRLLNDPNQQWKTAAFTQTKNTGTLYPLVEKPQAIFTNQYHYNYWGVYGEELYDRINDREEYTNLAGNPDYAAALDSMRNIRLNDWMGALPPPCDSANYYLDRDGDGYGNPDSIFKGCYQPFNYVIKPGDCNDSNAAINPDAVEICDGIDNNCNGLIDENGIAATVNPGGAVNLCKGSSLLLSANTGDNITYQWLKNNVAISGATKSTLSVTSAGQYSVRETDGICSTISAVTTVTIVAKPSATITALGSLDICSTGSVILVANSGTGYKYQWKKGSKNILGATDIQYVATTTGTYYVAVTNSNNCTAQSSGTKVTKSCLQSAVTTSELQISNNRTTNLFPNPSTGKLTITFHSNVAGAARLDVYDITGRLFVSKTIQALKGENSVLLNLSELATGVYYLNLTCRDFSDRIKFTISR